jgi:putative endonuclease
MRQFYVYILASRPGGALYVGVTNDLVRRVFEHKSGAIAGFTKRYNIGRLVYFEIYSNSRDAIQREKKHQTLAASLENTAHRGVKSHLA